MMTTRGTPAHSRPARVRTGSFCARAAVLAAMLAALLAVLFAPSARADNFVRVAFDPLKDQLVVTMSYRGTNPNHIFTLRWGQCVQAQDAGAPELDAEVLDSQWRDQAQQDYRKTTRFDLGGMPCRPAKLTLRSAPRFFYTLPIPAAAANASSPP
jgi:hypothetical protein